MSPKVTDARVVVRRTDRQSVVKETTKSFRLLEELFSQCLKTGDPDLVDRIVIRGTDEDGDVRTLTLIFHSITAPRRRT